MQQQQHPQTQKMNSDNKTGTGDDLFASLSNPFAGMGLDDTNDTNTNANTKRDSNANNKTTQKINASQQQKKDDDIANPFDMLDNPFGSMGDDNDNNNDNNMNNDDNDENNPFANLFGGNANNANTNANANANSNASNNKQKKDDFLGDDSRDPFAGMF